MLCLFLAGLTAIATVSAERVVPIPAAQLLPHPPMHWHSWNQFSGEGTVTDANMRSIADALVTTGMAAAGYDMVNVVCNGWGPRDSNGRLTQRNPEKWPTGMAGLGTYLHGKDLKMGCYTSPSKINCCGEPGSLGYEDTDMEFFAQMGCDHVMVDWCQPYIDPQNSRDEYARIGAAIANSSNPNMVYGIWHTGFGKSWKWAAGIGGHYWRVATDMSNSWDQGYVPDQPGAVLKNFDTAMSIPGIQRETVPGHFSFLDSLVVGVKPGGHSAIGPGLLTEEARAHFTMWVMAASPLFTCNDVRNMSDDIKDILTNPEVLAVHKDPLARMASRIDVGGGVDEPHTTSLSVSWSVYGKPLADGSVAVMVLNRAAVNQTVAVALEDVGDPFVTHYAIRDLWARANLSSVPVVAPMGYQNWHVNTVPLLVPAHGVRMLRMWPLPPAPTPPPTPPPPPPTPQRCPMGFTAHADGLWSNPLPCGVYPTPPSCTARDTANGTMALCGAKCKATVGCLAFEVSTPDCWIFVGTLAPPFTPYSACKACVMDKKQK